MVASMSCEVRLSVHHRFDFFRYLAAFLPHLFVLLHYLVFMSPFKLKSMMNAKLTKSPFLFWILSQ